MIGDSWGGRKGRVPMGLVGTIALVVAVERGMDALPPEFAASSALMDWRAAGREARGEEVRRSRVLCFGDSLVKLGIYPSILEAGLGRPAYNLALPALQAPGSYFLLRRALEAGARPDALIVDFHAVPLAFPPAESVEYWPELLGTRDLLGLARVSREPVLFGRLILARALPSLRNRRVLRSVWLARIEGRRRPEAELLPALLRNRRVNRGAWVMHRDARGPDSRIESAGTPPEGPRGERRWSPHRVNATYVQRFFDLAASRSIPVFWLLPPMHPTWQARADRNGGDSGLTDFVRAIQAGARRDLWVLDGRRSGFGGDSFADPTHLNVRGALAFSESVARTIRPLLGPRETAPSRRWIDLPATRDRTLDAPLEDLEQSIAAIQSPGGPSRR